MGPGARRWACELRLVPLAVAGLTWFLLLAGCGAGSRPPGATGAAPAPARGLATCPPCAGTAAQVRADTYATVAQRTYDEEIYGSPTNDAFAKITSLPGVLRGVATGDYALARRKLDGLPVRHAVRERLVRGGRVVLDVGLRYVVAGKVGPLLGADGRNLGTIEVSIQDVIGFIRLYHRLTGAEIVVRGSHHAKSSLPAALAVSLPASGSVRVSRRPYTVSSFRRLGFGGEQLSIWVLGPG